MTVTVRPLVRDVVRELLGRKFDPSQPRDDDGKWSSGFKAADKLKLNGLGPFVTTGATIVASDKARSRNASAVMAMTTVNGKPELRLGIVGTDDERKWSGGNRGGTVRLDQAGIDRLKSGLAGVAKSQDTWTNAKRDLIGEIEEFGGFDNGAELDDDEQEALDRYYAMADGGILDTGVLAAGSWGEIHYLVRGTEDEAPVETFIAVKPDGAPDDWEVDSNRDSAMEFNSGAGIKKFLDKVNEVTSADPDARSLSAGVVRKFDPSQPRDRRGRWKKGAAQQAAELADMLAKFDAMAADLNDDDDDDWDINEIKEKLTALRDRKKDKAVRREVAMDSESHGQIEMAIDGDGDINFSTDTGTSFLHPDYAKEVVAGIDKLRKLELPPNGDSETEVGRVTTSDGATAVVLWGNGLFEIGDAELIDPEETQADSILLETNDEADEFADLLEELADRALEGAAS